MRAITKDFTREIKNTKSRFISILVLVSLAVAFLSGLRATAPDMKLTGHNYLEEQKLADIQIMSTVGLTDEDLEKIKENKLVEDAVATYVIDAFCASPSTDKISKVYAIEDSEINKLLLMEGRMPEKTDECVVEEKALGLLNIKLGDKVSLTPQESFEENLTVKEFTVVGTVRSPIYVSVERGSASIGTGSVAMYMAIPKEAFDSEIYTTIFLRLVKDSNMISFYQEYDDFIDDFIDSIEPFGNKRADIRYESLEKKLDDAQGELDDAKEEADEKFADAEKKLNDADKQIKDGKIQIADAEVQIADAEVSISNAALDIADAEIQIADAEVQLADGQAQIDDAEAKIADAEKELADGEQKLADAKKELEDGEKEYEDGKKKYLDGRADWYWGASQLAEGSRQLEASQQQINTAMAGFDALATGFKPYLGGAGITAESSTDDVMNVLAVVTDPSVVDPINYGLSLNPAAVDQNGNPYTVSSLVSAYQQTKAGQAQIDSARGSLANGQLSLDDGWWELEDAREKLEEARKELDDGWQEYYDGFDELEEGKQKLADGKADLEKGKADFEKGKAEFEKGKADLEEGKQKYEDGRLELEKAKNDLADAKVTIAKGEVDYKKGLKEYEDAKAEADEKIADAQHKIDDAREDLSDITEVKWYVLGRSYNPGYTGLGQDADRMGNLAKVFPIIFFLVAALVCLTTMTRMVEEQRILIGGMKALGYSSFDISKKYIGYGLIPSLIGSIIGLAVGFTLFPAMIFTAYQIMYQMPNIELHIYNDIAIGCTVAAVACTTVSTLAACLATLRENPASLMRPKTPQAGKRVFLEYVGFIWKRMKFIHKVTARNLFRYKKRFLMTVIGIGGCTALIIAGFGIKYSLTYTMTRQYDELMHYDAQISISNGIDDEDRAAIEDFLDNDDRVVQYTNLRLGSMTAVSPKRSQSIYLYTIEADELPAYIDLYDFKTGQPLTLNDDGIFIDEKLSELLNVGIGDEIFLDGDDKTYATVAAVIEHYTGHFCYMTPSYYEKIYGKPCEKNGAFLTLTGNSEELCDSVFEDLMAYEGVAGTSRMLAVKDTYLNSMERIDFVVVIVILSAGALALVVLYNLSNINITERKRELATIKVLGFYDGEVSAYVYRENVFLTLFGIALGILMGHYLHIWLVMSTEIDMMMFGRETNPRAYLWAAALTAAFSLLANLMAHFKMKKIDMVESLKSAE